MTHHLHPQRFYRSWSASLPILPSRFIPSFQGFYDPPPFPGEESIKTRSIRSIVSRNTV